MSRTYRRKNYEKQYLGKWFGISKQFGYYAEYDIDYVPDRPGHNWLRVWREPTKEEYFKNWYMAHGDKGSYLTEAPPRWYRNMKRRKERANFKTQYHKWLKNPEFEIISQLKIAQDNWDWY